MTFSALPSIVHLEGETLAEKVACAVESDWGLNTNLEAAFDSILKTAVENHVPEEEMPKSLIIISDMEFDYCVENANETNFNNAKKAFEEKGYKLPNIIFWNVTSRNSNQPVTKNEQGVALVSGVTPRLFSMVASGELSPYKFMIETISNKRYAKIVA